MNQCNSLENPEINPFTYGQLIFNKGGKLYNGEKTVSSASGVGKVGQPHINQRSYNTPTHHTQKETQNGLKT